MNSSKPHDLKRILVLASTFPRWDNDSTPPFVYELARRLSAEFEITVLAPHAAGARDFQITSGLKVYRFRYFWPSGLELLCYNGGIFSNLKRRPLLLIEIPFLIISQIIYSAYLIKINKTDFIHAHWIIPQGITAYILKKIFGLPYIITSHGTDVYGLRHPFF